MRKTACLAGLVVLFLADIVCAEDPSRLGRIVVTPSRLKTPSGENSRSITVIDRAISNISAYTAIQDIIGDVGGIDIRRRGAEAVQSDINIRGATFEQNTVMIDGIGTNDPQTGHFNMDLPLTTLDVDRTEILKGPASSLYGPNSFGGVINLMTEKPEGTKFIVNSQGGSFDYFQTAMSITNPFGPIANRFSIEESRSGGYLSQTEFNIFTLSEKAVIDTFLGTYDFLFGYSKKDFGADSFYSNIFSNEEEHTDTRFFKIAGSAESGSLTFTPRLYLRRHRDKFILDTNRPGWQTNYHTNYTYGLQLNFSLTDKFLDTAYGFELSRDTIDSTNLQTHHRGKSGVYIEVSPKIWERLYLNIGLRQDYFSDFGLEYSPSVSASYKVIKNLSIRGMAGRSYRIPTFTDLYYIDSANIGNSGLRPESSWTYEAGADYTLGPLLSSATFFNRNSYDTIDWIRYNANAAWQASNIGSSTTNGFELSLDVRPKEVYKSVPIERLFFGYTVLDVYNKHDYLSKYALDYLRQQISAGIEYSLFDFTNSWVLNYKKRIGDSGFVVADMKVSKGVIKKDRLSLDAFLEITNIFNIKYSEQSGVQMPGRWIKSGARLRF